MTTSARRTRPGLKHPLRIYERFFSMFVWPSFLLAIALYVLWWISFDYPIPLPLGRAPILLVSILAWLAYIFGLIAPAFCYVQCYPNYIVISALYPLAISYSRVGNAVPINFNTKYPLSRQSWSERNFLEPLFYEQKTGQLTVVGMQLREYPLPLPWLKLWFNKFMFFTKQDGPGFLFLVRNWMALSHEIEDYREAWRSRRFRKTRGVSVASRVLASKGDRKR